MGASCSDRNCSAPRNPCTHSLQGHAIDQFQRSLSFIQAGAGDINEMFLVAQECGNGADPLQWSTSWEALAERTFNDGKARIDDNPSGAATALLRSCNYSRTSAFFIRGYPEHDEQKKKAYSRSDDAFRLAAPLFHPPLAEVKIPIRDGSSPDMLAYIGKATRPPPGFQHSPLFIGGSGYDGDIAETFMCNRRLVEDFGFNLLIFDGPGQGIGAVTKNTALRHDWEVVLGSVIDFAANEFDLKHGLVVYAWSLGGHLTARACLHEARPDVFVLDPINPSLKRAANTKMPAAFLEDMLSDSPGSTTYGTILRWLVEKKAYQSLASRAQVHGIDVTDSSWLPTYIKEIQKFHCEDEEFEKLQVPLILCAAENDAVVGDMSKPAALIPYINKSAVGDQCVVIPFTEKEGAGNHCEGGNRVLVWERVMDDLLPLLLARISQHGD